MPRLTPEQFKALAKWKGWTFREISERWGITTVWMSKITSNPDRAPHYDDALVGLPNKRTMARDARVLEKRLAALVGAKRFDREAKETARRPSGEYRYHGFFTVGAILTAASEIGSLAEEGARGIVFQVQDSGRGERYGVIFETGLWDWFEPKHIDDMLVMTGLTDTELGDFVFEDEEQLQAAFEAGQFTFWP